MITLYHLSWYGKATNKPKTTRPPGHTSEWVKQQSTMRKPGIPPARIPEITWHRPSRHNDSPERNSKQTPATPGRSESGETQNRVRRWVKKELRTHCIDSVQGTLRVRSVVLFQSSYSQGSSVHISNSACWKTLDLLPPEWGSGERPSTRKSLMAPSLQFAASCSTLVLLQVVFMVWKIMFIISAWRYLCIKLFRWCACPFGCMWQQQ